jgi:hypothetical protein
MHRMLLLAVLALAACSESQASRVAIDDRTFKIEGPPFASGIVGPNRRMAEQICPKGYRLLNEEKERRDINWGTVVTWTIRCL